MIQILLSLLLASGIVFVASDHAGLHLRRVQGRSMVPVLKDGDVIVTVRYAERGPCKRKARAGDVAVVMLADGPVVKKIAAVVEDRVELRGEGAVSRDSRDYGFIGSDLVRERVVLRIPLGR